jgi:hypothetical protein
MRWTPADRIPRATTVEVPLLAIDPAE